MLVAGINFGYDGDGSQIKDGAAALLCDGIVVAAVAEERIARIKHSGGFGNALKHVMAVAGVSAKDLDCLAVSFYQHPMELGDKAKGWVAKILADSGIGAEICLIPSHHRSHAAASFLQSPFEEALICVWDNEGSVLGNMTHRNLRFSERHSYYLGRGNEIRLVCSELTAPGDMGFGQTYARFTNFAGLGDYSNAGKLMGLSAYGDPERFGMFAPLWTQNSDGRLRSSMRFTDKEWSIPLMFMRNGMRPPSKGGAESHTHQVYRDLAAFVQRELETAAVARVRSLLDETGARAVCIGGGVGLNSILNGRLQEELGVPVFVPPYPDDKGQAIGNVLLTYCDALRVAGSQHIYRWPAEVNLGGEWSSADISSTAADPEFEACFEFSNVSDVSSAACNDLLRSKLIGWFQGRSEYGARALGWRSILADPGCTSTRDLVNRLKGRELFRPVAPAVTLEAANEYFTLSDSPLWLTMSGTVQVLPAARLKIPAVVHVDGSARVQTVSRSSNPLFHELLNQFATSSGVPVLVNTSFNSAGEPIVESPADALRSAWRMQLPVTYIGNLRAKLRNAQ